MANNMTTQTKPQDKIELYSIKQCRLNRTNKAIGCLEYQRKEEVQSVIPNASISGLITALSCGGIYSIFGHKEYRVEAFPTTVFLTPIAIFSAYWFLTSIRSFLKETKEINNEIRYYKSKRKRLESMTDSEVERERDEDAEESRQCGFLGFIGRVGKRVQY